MNQTCPSVQIDEPKVIATDVVECELKEKCPMNYNFQNGLYLTCADCPTCGQGHHYLPLCICKSNKKGGDN